MTDNMKKLLEMISANQELAQKAAGADKDTLIALAKELGVELTDADFQQSNELSDDELDAVAGGGTCVCFLGGGGSSSGVAQTCACAVGGLGTMSDGDERCLCAVGGSGKDNPLEGA